MPDLIKSWERRYIRKVCQGQKRTNLLVNVVADVHYRVYPKTVEYYHVSDLDHEYHVVQPDERENLRQELGKNHFWHL